MSLVDLTKLAPIKKWSTFSIFSKRESIWRCRKEMCRVIYFFFSSSFININFFFLSSLTSRTHSQLTRAEARGQNLSSRATSAANFFFFWFLPLNFKYFFSVTMVFQSYNTERNRQTSMCRIPFGSHFSFIYPLPMWRSARCLSLIVTLVCTLTLHTHHTHTHTHTRKVPEAAIQVTLTLPSGHLRERCTHFIIEKSAIHRPLYLIVKKYFLFPISFEFFLNIITIFFFFFFLNRNHQPMKAFARIHPLGTSFSWPPHKIIKMYII